VPTETVQVRVYTIEKCGFYKWGGSSPEFGSLPKTLASLLSWSTGKALQDTNTFDPAASGALGTFCLSLLEHNGSGDFLLVLWNAAPTTAAGVANVKGSSPVGSPALSTTAIPEGTISGFATYFWFLPSEGRVVTAQVHKRATCLHELKQYMKGFLEKFSSHTVLQNGEIIGYRVVTGSEVRSDVWPRFDTGVIRRAAFLDVIRARRPDIKRLVRRETLALGSADDPGILSKLLGALGLDPPAVARDQLTVTYQLEMTPTDPELASMIHHWSAKARSGDERMGFEIDGQKLWLDEALVKSRFALNVKWLSPEVLDPESLLAALEGIRPKILALETDA